MRNDWSPVAVPPLGQWRPTRTVSVVIPAYQCQPSLDLTLASLAYQTYPAELLEVVVVDDGSQPPLTLPKLRPARCRVIRPEQGWGRANALRAGAEESTGEIIHWLDADMVVYPTHVEAQARWHHQLPYAVTLGWKRFVDVAPDAPYWPTADQVAAACDEDAAGELFNELPSTGHDYVEAQIARTRQLRDADHTGFLAHVGATAALRRELYQATGGLDSDLRLGEDTEFGYRLAQAGALFVPEPAAHSWHLGATHMMRHELVLQRYNRPFLADRMPQPRWLRRVGGTGWSVPLVTVVAPVGGQSLERVRAAVDSVLASDEADLRVALVGPWRELSAERGSPLHDPQLDLRLLAATYQGDPRVRLLDEAPTTGFPSPYLLRLPPAVGLTRPALRRLLEYADSGRLGLVRVELPGAGTAELWRTAALHRAGWVREEGETLAAVVAEVYGAGTLPAEQVGVVDLAGFPEAMLTSGPVLTEAPVGRWLPSSVEVAGARSLGRAAWMVARLAVTRATRRLRRR
ncbi:glycosyltransferase family 2 protein [Natronosporangium hydrolyticum]|uniref:Glycosyltransferase family 2 protein n=1 Tax=Natronosporangium hydrolyticum TaxID=2811111 RepID=A0A895Y944_9ACTN|nr:glycosyltransferase [Natronosporangium hydrolyticum]QSB14257.1 glycosyltransferase family 2 protein [Natronosporangium hydrolyticum]